jgi:hypothetical protein
MSESDFEHEQEEAAAAEAAGIGGKVSYDPPDGEDRVDPAEAPLIEAGEGESEGFELAEQELEEHASHGDMHAARRVLEDAPAQREEPSTAEPGEADAEPSSERSDDR